HRPVTRGAQSRMNADVLAPPASGAAAQAKPRSGFPLIGLVRLTLAECGADDWTVTEDDFWCRVNPPDRPERIQGWKLHVSATPLSAAEVLHRAATVLIGQRCPFKF